MSQTVQQTTPAAAAPAAGEVHPEEPLITKPSFKSTNGSNQFFVQVPKNLIGNWIKTLDGSYNQGQRSYVFLMKHLAEVEKAVGLAPGESGLHDPLTHFPVQFEGEFYCREGREALEKKLEPFGFVWKRQNKRFVGPTQNLEAVKQFLAK